MSTTRLKYIQKERDRHGNVRRYFRPVRKGLRTRLAEPFQSQVFWRHYAACLEAHTNGDPIPPAIAFCPSARAPAAAKIEPGSWRWLCVEYFASATFKSLDPTTQHRRRRILELICDEEIAPGDKRTFGQMPLRHFGRRAVVVIRDRRSDKPEAGNGRLKAVRGVFRWALASSTPGAEADPTRDVTRLEVKSGGFHSWTVEEVEKYRARHPIGTTPRLALEMLLLLGVRRSDVVKIGRPHCRDGWVRFRPTKGQARSPQLLELPLLPELESVIAASQTGELTFLVSQYGRPFTAAGFGMRFRAWCDAAGLPNCSAHGLRKAGATIAAENGAKPHQLMAIFGWRTLAEAERYTRAFERKKLAGEAMGLLVRSAADGEGQRSGKPRKQAKAK